MVLTLFALVIYTVFAAVVASVPIYLAIEAYRGVKGLAARSRPLTRERARAQAELREQYASGMLTLVGLEERLDETFSARSHLELAHVLDDLPARPPPLPRAARAEVLAAVAIVLVLHSLTARVVGVALAFGAVMPEARWRPLGYAFLAGLALIGAPLAAIPLAACAAWRQRG